jgi:hypothetical protein
MRNTFVVAIVFVSEEPLAIKSIATRTHAERSIERPGARPPCESSTRSGTYRKTAMRGKRDLVQIDT